MSDTQTGTRIRVLNQGKSRPYIMVTVDQLPLVRGLLDRHSVEYWVETVAISLNGEPATAFINLGFSTDCGWLQAILDDAQ